LAEQPEEVRRLVEAIEAFETIADDVLCARTVSKALEDWPDLHARLRELRQARVLRLREQGKTWKEIGQLLGGVTAARAQQIGVGHRGDKRPKKQGASPGA
jgi:DNA-directed RNA polymerase sigma subunit (sigma70/sigma32)